MDTKTKDNTQQQSNNANANDKQLADNNPIPLNTLLSSITKDNVHEEVDTGEMVGKEVL